jgi:hypothetical protein
MAASMMATREAPGSVALVASPLQRPTKGDLAPSAMVSHGPALKRQRSQPLDQDDDDDFELPYDAIEAAVVAAMATPRGAHGASPGG